MTQIQVIRQNTYNPATVANALSLWAAARTNGELKRSEDLQRDKVQIVKQFFDATQIHPADVLPTDVKGWAEGLTHLSPASRYKAVSRLSSFYKWLAEQSGFEGIPNPAAAARPKAPKPYATEASKSLSDEQITALIEVIKTDSDTLADGRPDLTAKRDYAMFMMHLAKGIRRDGIASLMYRDVQISGNGLRVTFRNKGGDLITKDINDADVRAALVDYIDACKSEGRAFDKTSPMFVAHRYGSMSQRMINSRSFANNLKRYALRAGIADIHVHQLRHTFARLAGEELGSMTDVQSELNHSSSNTTRVYLQRVGIEKDKSSQVVMSRFKKVKE